MKRHRAAALPALVLAVASCTGTAPVQVAASPTGGYCASVAGYIPPADVRPQLLFACAESTLTSGSRYFRLTASSESSYPLPPMNPADQTSATREGSMCFVVLSEPGRSPDAYDSVLVIQQASPALRGRLSPEARRKVDELARAQAPS
jgi:hypothetical protein